MNTIESLKDNIENQTWRRVWDSTIRNTWVAVLSDLDGASEEIQKQASETVWGVISSHTRPVLRAVQDQKGRVRDVG